ncbi:MAG: FG-GAP-like repeat-containing protein [Bryobacteraceae bacterium]
MRTGIRQAARLACMLLTASLSTLPAVTPTFVPDVTFKGSTLQGWHALGGASWRAKEGELTGSGEGWVVLDRSYQDVGFFASFQAEPSARTGVLLRAEKTPEGGLKGVYVDLSEGELGTYSLVLDANGRELKREKLRPTGGQIRIAPPPGGPPMQMGGLPPVSAPPGVTLPLSRPSSELRSGDWNQVEIVVDANIIRPHLNEGGAGITSGVAEEEFGRFGPVALYVGGKGTVRFKDIAYRDLSVRFASDEHVSLHVKMLRLNEFYYSWSAAAADVNHDGVMDIVAGPYYYLGPDYKVAREIYLAQTRNPSTQYATTMVTFAHDFTGDGWPDVVTISPGQPATLYVNPKGEPRRWDKFTVVPKLLNEVAVLKDIDGDGEPEIIYGADGYLRYAKPDRANPTGDWMVHTVTEKGPWGTTASHGLVVGDINGDGRLDLVQAFGWWEHPAHEDGKPWTYHPTAFGRWGRVTPGGAEMGIYDVNGDGLNDIVTGLEAHGFGLAWFEQKRDATGNISFVEHVVMDDFSTKNAGGVTFSELHGSTAADVDGDGLPDYIVGKRYWSHEDSYTDPDPYGEPVLYYYRTVRNPKAPGGAELVPELIHNRSGVGSTIAAVDVNGDGAVDILTSTDRGTFVFLNEFGKGKRPKALRTE